jgi:hypothetical protein
MIGETVVCKLRVLIEAGPDCDGLDTTYIQWREGIFDRFYYPLVHYYLS